MYPTSPIITVGQVAITLLVLLSYPLQCHPCRASLDKVIDACLPPTRVISQEDAEDQAGHEEQDATTTTTTTTTIVPPPSSPAAVIKEIPQTRFIALTTGIIISSYILAISVRNLSTVTSIREKRERVK